MATGLHYSHKLPWSSIVDLYRSNKHPSIKLPVGECNEIHIVNNRIKHQVKNRKYLHDNVCNDPDCKVVGEAEFRKSQKLMNDLFIDKIKISQPHPMKEYFIKKFQEAVFDYIDTMKKDGEPLDITYPEGFPSRVCMDCERCDRLTMLMETKNFAALEKYDIDELRNIFSHTTSQLFASHMGELFCNVFNVYFITNVIFASNNTQNISNWGRMKPDDYWLRMSLNSKMGGPTFLLSCTKYLKDDVYMKDLNATKKLCEKCFEFMCIYTMMEVKAINRDEIGLEYISNLI